MHYALFTLCVYLAACIMYLVPVQFRLSFVPVRLLVVPDCHRYSCRTCSIYRIIIICFYPAYSLAYPVLFCVLRIYQNNPPNLVVVDSRFRECRRRGISSCAPLWLDCTNHTKETRRAWFLTIECLSNPDWHQQIMSIYVFQRSLSILSNIRHRVVSQMPGSVDLNIFGQYP